jgi:hypothetical protein
VLCASSKADSSKTGSSNSKKDTDINLGSSSSSTAAAGGAHGDNLAHSKQQHAGPAGKAAQEDAGSDDEFEHQTDYANGDEDECKDEYEDGDEGSEDKEGSTLSDLMTDADATMEVR